MTAFDELLTLQELDLRGDQLRYRLEKLPQREAVASIGVEIAEFDAAGELVRAERDDLARQQKRYEDEVATVEAKASEIDSTLYGGGVTSPKELQALQAELDSVRNRQRQIEDQVIEVMELIDPLDSDLDARASARTQMEQRRLALVEELGEAEREVLAELDEVDSARAALSPSIAPELLSHYEGLRERYDGIGVAKLTGATCGGCHLMLSATELDRVRHEPADALVHCDECGRLLVR